MKTMKIEKKLLFAEKINEVNQLEVKAALVYQDEGDGSIRASGPLFIRGNMRLDNGEAQTFQEVLDMDVLAPAYKLSGEPFSLKVKDYFADVDEDGIALSINMNIMGLIEEGQMMPSEVVEPMETPFPVMSQPVSKPQKVIADDKASKVSNEDETLEVTSVEQFEDLFEESDTTYTSYRMVVAKSDDSYTSISKRYDVSEEDLRAVNRNKDVQAKTLIVLPF